MKFTRSLRLFVAGIVLAISITPARADDDTQYYSTVDTWANWTKRLDDAFKGVPTRKLPGRAMGILVPSESRDDILALTAFGYEVVQKGDFHSVIILMQAPEDYQLDGIAAPTVESLETPFGTFNIDTALRDALQNNTEAILRDPDLFKGNLPKPLARQLAFLKYTLQKDVRSIKILPLYVKFSNPNSQAKDFAPFIVDRIRDYGNEQDLMFVIVANMTKAPSEEVLVQTDTALLKSLRALDFDGMISVREKAIPDVKNDDFSALTLGTLTLRWLGADHSEIFAYAHSGQLVLTKNKKAPLSYLSAGYASKPPFNKPAKHVSQEKMAETFGELIRADLLALVRQTCLSTLDSTAAKPPALANLQAGKKWPVYVSIFDPQGKLVGQAGSHVEKGPLEESLRKFTFDATRKAESNGLTKANAQNHVLEVSIPYGFEFISHPDDYVPLLTGIVVTQRLKKSAVHPDMWRTYPDPHQLLGVISTRLGEEPWSYATTESKLESFRVFSFNEKEPFQDLGAATRKKKKKKNDDELLDEGGGGGGGGGSAFTF